MKRLLKGYGNEQSFSSNIYYICNFTNFVPCKKAQTLKYYTPWKRPFIKFINSVSRRRPARPVTLQPIIKQTGRLTAGLGGSSVSWGGYTCLFLLSQFFDSREALVWRHDSCWGPPPTTCSLDRRLGKMRKDISLHLHHVWPISLSVLRLAPKLQKVN